MSLADVLAILENHNFIAIFFKSVAILLSVLYLLYGLVISKQTQVMNDTLEVNGSKIITFISSLQITIGLLLVLSAIVLLW